MTREEALAGLRALIGRDSPPGAWVTVTQAQIDVHSRNANDPQWIHTDVARARRESPYGTTVAHAFLTLAMVNPLTEPTSPFLAIRRAARYSVNYGLNRVRFPAPVPAGARVRGRNRLLTAEPVGPDALQYTWVATIEVEGSPKPACVAEVVHRLYY